ncbi:MAG TPA: septal ring lytic transglycosylase RlpA family protein [Candidatus Methanoperedens sp.]|nr:septal ring lytic transglycosylase RlpA family protein [Candidatus Methanoperedens sp.]
MRKLQMSRAAAGAVLLSLLALACGCAGARRGGGGPNWREEGLASWYGADFHGRRTANGERYNMYAMTAAHKTLPLGTRVTVTHRGSGRRIRVRVNDRGPFVAGRVIDLSLAAARALGSAEDGVVPVLLEAELPAAAFAGGRRAVPGTPSFPAAPAPLPLRGAFAVQVGAFSLEANARRQAARLAESFRAVRVVEFRDNRAVWWRVRVGGYGDEEAASTAAAAFAELGQPGFVVRED